MSLTLNIAKRLRLSGKNGGRAPSVPVAIAGVALSLAVMILAVAVVVGFKREISEKVRGFDSDLKVHGATLYLTDGTVYQPPVISAIRDSVAAQLPDANVSLAANTQGVLKTADNFAGVVFMSYDDNHRWDFIRGNLTAGNVPDYSNPDHNNDIVISVSIAKDLGLTLDDKVDAYFFADGNLRARRFKVAGIYDTHFNDYDRQLCFASINTVRRLAGLDSVSGNAIEVRGIPTEEIKSSGQRLETALYAQYLRQRASNPDVSSYVVEDVSRTGAIYFNWLDLLDTNVVVILILMSCVAAFTLVSCLFTLVLERVRFIGTLKAFGATNSQITKIFMWLGARIVLMGVILGDVIGLGLALAQSAWHIIPLDPEAYYLTSVPIYLNVWQIVAVNVGVLALTALILLIPSRMIAKVTPASTMRYE